MVVLHWQLGNSCNNNVQSYSGAKRTHNRHDKTKTADGNNSKNNTPPRPLPGIGDVLAVNLLRLLKVEGAAAIWLHHRQQQSPSSSSHSSSLSQEEDGE